MIFPAKGSDYSPYAQLVAALLPRAGGVTVFAPDGELCWTSEDSISSEAKSVVAASAAAAPYSDEAGETRQYSLGDLVYLFWLRDEDHRLNGVLAISWRGGESEPKSFAYVHAMLRPMLECLRREIMLRSRSSAAPRAAVAEPDHGEADLQVLLATSEQADGAGDGMRELLQSVNRHMQCEFTALLVPERRLAVVIKAEDREADTSALATIHRQLLLLAQSRNETLLLNAADSLPGVTLTQRILCSPIRNRAGRPVGVLVLFRNQAAGEFRRRHALLADLLVRRATSLIDASYDSLTGLATRVEFERRVRQMQQAAAGRGAQWTGLYIDVDRLHGINDNHGMMVGDRLLAQLGELLRARLPRRTLAARISGDRFAILLPSAVAEAADVAEALRAGAAALTGAQLGASAAGFAASISIGIAAADASRGDLLQAVAAAETACNVAKERGRNRVEIYQPMASAMREADDGFSEATVRAIINANRLCLHAQLFTPLPGTRVGAPHYEVLLRVLEDSGDVVGSCRFMAAAARHQLLPAVDRWVVQQVTRQLQPHATLLADRAVVFAINLSGPTLGDAGFVEFVIDQLKASGIAPQAFSFELPERDVLANPARAAAVMQGLRDAGCALALDNFGTGLSSLAQLRALPLDMLKIDGSFVRDVLTDPRAESMVQTMAQMAHSMNLFTAAGRVETDELRQRLAQLGVDYGQGFVIARPAPLAAAIRDLPTCVAVARRRQGEELELGDEEDTISADLQQLLLADGIEASEHDAAMARMERMLAGHNHGESVLYQRKPG